MDDQGRIILERLEEYPVERLIRAGTACFGDVDPVAYQRSLREDWDR